MRPLPRPSLRLASLPASAGALLLATSAVLGGGPSATTSVEAGAYLDFVAPDSGTSTPGSIRFGFTGIAEVISADALLEPPADTNLAFLGGARRRASR